MIKEMDKAIGMNEVAKILSVHRQTVWNLVKAGKIRAVRVSPGRRAVMHSEMLRYLNSLSSE